MKSQIIRTQYTQKVTELLNQGYTIFPDTMAGSQGEIAHIDLAKGSEIIRVLLTKDCSWRDDFYGDVITLTVGRAAPETRVRLWDGTVWNNRLETLFEIKWAEISRRDDWYTDMEEGKRIEALRYTRRRAREIRIREDLGDAYKSVALRWLRNQPRMKSCKLADIEKMVRVIDDKGTRRFEITARGNRYTMG